MWGVPEFEEDVLGDKDQVVDKQIGNKKQWSSPTSSIVTR